jgi:hypothetical protein
MRRNSVDIWINYKKKVYSFANRNVLFQIVRSRQRYFNHLYEIERDRAGEGVNDMVGKLASVRKGEWSLKRMASEFAT